MKENKTEEIASLYFSTFRVFKHKLDWGNPMFQLPMAQMEALRLIGEKRQASMKELADFLAITPPSATVLVNNLVRFGYVKRGSDKTDRRAIHLSLTSEGSAILEKGIRNRCSVLKKLLDKLNSKEQINFLHILKKMSGN